MLGLYCGQLLKSQPHYIVCSMVILPWKNNKSEKRHATISQRIGLEGTCEMTTKLLPENNSDSTAHKVSLLLTANSHSINRGSWFCLKKMYTLNWSSLFPCPLPPLLDWTHPVSYVMKAAQVASLVHPCPTTIRTRPARGTWKNTLFQSY